ncbi:ABC transporter substrate-binding protein, partial [Moorena sp. SIOASIH]|uniref:ABC transporter substrate-binding protein n=1 Tax=Moorena sp. SIOASIH TaxID=2607817 RepID=UPI00344F942D
GTIELEPGLATDWEASRNSRVWTFKLRQGVKFHDGTDFDAEAWCGVWGVGCGVWGVGCGVWGVGCGRKRVLKKTIALSQSQGKYSAVSCQLSACRVSAVSD